MSHGYKDSDLKPLREKQNNQYIPEDQQIRQYAAYIGVNLEEEEYMWELVKEGVMTSLPTGWEACQTPQGEIVYRNVKTRHVQEEHPMDQVYRQKVIELREAYNKYQEFGSQSEDLNTIPQQKSEQRSLKDSSYLDEAMMPSKQLYSPSNVLKQESSSSLNKGMVLHETNSRDLPAAQNSKMLINLSVDQTNRLQSYQSQDKSQSASQREKKKSNYSEESIQTQKERLKKQLEMLLKQQKLAQELLNQLKRDNMRRMQKIKNRKSKTIPDNNGTKKQL